MSEEKFYRCIPELNKECKKNNCYINGGECETTIYKKYTLKGLLEEIERLNKENSDLQNIANIETSKNEYLEKENERLNNIIYNLEDKLNKLIEEQLEQYNKRVENWEEKRNVSNTWLTSRDCYYSVLKYLQKLKGVDRE